MRSGRGQAPRWSRWALGAGLAWIGATAVLTLRPGSMSPFDLAEVPTGCLICGSRGSADALLNAAMFVPLGLLLGGARRSLLAATLVGLALSISIEFAQTAIPGRHAAVADVVWNTLGAAGGVIVYALASRRVLGRTMPMEAAGWLAAAAVVLLAGGALSVPAPSDRDYWALLTPRLFGVEEYDGSVLSAGLDGHPLPHGPVADAGALALRQRAWELDAEIVVGPAPAHPAPVVLIGNPEPDPAEIVFLGVHRDGLVFRERMRAHEMRFDAPDLRFDGVLAGRSPGEHATLAVRRHPDGTTCLAVDDEERCGLAVTPGRLWGYLQYLEGPPEGVRRVIDVGWLILLFAPAGFFAVGRRRRLRMLAGAPLVVVLSAALTPLGLHALELPAAAVGVLLGAALADMTRRLCPVGDAGHTPPASEPLPP